MRTKLLGLGIIAMSLSGFGCVAELTPDEMTEDQSESAVTESSWDALGVLAVANRLTTAQLTNRVGLSPNAAGSILAYRLGDDGQAGSSDDNSIDTIAELDTISFVTATEIDALRAYAQTKGYIDAFKRAVPYVPGQTIQVNAAGTYSHHTQFWTSDGRCVTNDSTSATGAYASITLTPVYGADMLRHRIQVQAFSSPWWSVSSPMPANVQSTSEPIPYDFTWTMLEKGSFSPESVQFELTSSGIRMASAHSENLNAGFCSGAGSYYYAVNSTTPWPLPTNTAVVLPTEDEDLPSPVVINATDLGAGDLIVTEIMANPSVCPDTTGEWFEVYNATSARVSLSGLTVKNRSGAQGTVSSSATVNPGEFAILGRGSAQTFCGSIVPSGFYGSKVSLGNSSDQVSLLAGTSSVIDRTCLYGSKLAKSGKSAVFTGELNASANDDCSAWQVATQAIGQTPEKGTPGSH